MNQHVAITPVVDERADQRHLTVLIIGKVRGTRGEIACVINDVSRSGLQARFPYPPAVGDRLTFGLRGVPDQIATVRWADGLRAGVEFDAPIDLTAVLATHCATRVHRGPRFACGKPASLIVGGRGHAINLVDVSLSGAKLELQANPGTVIGSSGTLILPILAEARAGIVRWQRGERAGFKFSRALTLDALAEVLSGVQSKQ